MGSQAKVEISRPH